jgi:hypothetical protein
MAANDRVVITKEPIATSSGGVPLGPDLPHPLLSLVGYGSQPLAHSGPFHRCSGPFHRCSGAGNDLELAFVWYRPRD